MARKTSIRWDSVERAVHRSLAAGRIVRAALKYLEGRRCVIHATAATKIQSLVRGNKARKDLVKQDTAAIKLQSVWKGRVARKELVGINDPRKKHTCAYGVLCAYIT